MPDTILPAARARGESGVVPDATAKSGNACRFEFLQSSTPRERQEDVSLRSMAEMKTIRGSRTIYHVDSFYCAGARFFSFGRHGGGAS